jgi:hypothetical protein
VATLIFSWNFTQRNQAECTVNLFNDHIQVEGELKFSLASFFEKYDPLEMLTLEDQVEVISYLATHFPPHIQISQFAASVHAFWNAWCSIQLEEKTIRYTTKISNTSRWELIVNKNGLSLLDIDKHYGEAFGRKDQNLADFWFYGPRYPLRGESLRKEILFSVRNALVEAGFEYPDSHFPILKYPSFIRFPEWTEGDHVASDFVILREYGVEYGRQNFHDGLVWLDFASYEQCMTRKDLANGVLTQGIMDQIREYLIS